MGNAPRPGTDIVSVARVARIIDAHGHAFLERWFTAGEIAYCSAKARPALHFAARLAAKEAVVKALGGPTAGPVPLADIEIDSGADGEPIAVLHGRVRDFADLVGRSSVQVSLSHCDEFATAVAIAGS